MSAGVENLFEMLRASRQNGAYESLKQDFENGTLKYAELKQAVADSLVSMTNPFKERKAELLSDKKNLKRQIKHSSAEIRKKAAVTVSEVKELIGLMKS